MPHSLFFARDVHFARMLYVASALLSFCRESYKGSSFMLDSELPSIMKTFLQGKGKIVLLQLGKFFFDEELVFQLSTWTLYTV